MKIEPKLERNTVQINYHGILWDIKGNYSKEQTVNWISALVDNIQEDEMVRLEVKIVKTRQ